MNTKLFLLNNYLTLLNKQMNEYGERGFRLKEIVKCGGNDAYFLIIMERETPMFKESLMKV